MIYSFVELGQKHYLSMTSCRLVYPHRRGVEMILLIMSTHHLRIFWFGVCKMIFDLCENFFSSCVLT